MEIQPVLSLVIFLLLHIPPPALMKDSRNAASILSLPLLLCLFSLHRLFHLHLKKYTGFRDEKQLLGIGFVDQVYVKSARKERKNHYTFGRTTYELEENIAFSLDHGLHCLRYFCCNSQKSGF